MTRSKTCVAIIVAMLTSASFSMTAQSVIPRPMPQSDFLRPVDITGEVNKSGTFPVIDAPTLAQLLQMAGGLISWKLIDTYQFDPHTDLIPQPARLVQMAAR